MELNDELVPNFLFLSLLVCNHNGMLVTCEHVLESVVPKLIYLRFAYSTNLVLAFLECSARAAVRSSNLVHAFETATMGPSMAHRGTGYGPQVGQESRGHPQGLEGRIEVA